MVYFTRLVLPPADFHPADNKSISLLAIIQVSAFALAWMAGKKEFSGVVVKTVKSCFQIFSVPDGECEQICEVLKRPSRGGDGGGGLDAGCFD